MRLAGYDVYYDETEIGRLDAEVAAGRGHWFVVYAMVALTPDDEVPTTGPWGPFATRADAKESIVPWRGSVEISYRLPTGPSAQP
ncbi:MAG: hypothetical protein Q8P41_09890 [Pseudomonadota bacterium]|nr:hypothetical protein [Pseudomonadota bacterium]